MRKLTDDSMFAANPKWSPLGKQILFADGFCDPCENDLWVMKADGKNPEQFTNTLENEPPGEWSPDGKYAVVEYLGFPPGGPPIFDLAVVKVSNGGR